MRLLSVVSVALATSLTLAARPAATQVVTPPVVPSTVAGISVSAIGEEQVTPDRARLSIGVQTQAPTAADASARNARAQRAIFDTLRAMGILPEQLTTSGYNVFPEQVYDQPTRRTRITGYNVQNTVVVDLRRIDQVGPVLDAVLSKGANLVSSLQFYSSQSEEVRRRALANAVQRARADAESMARAAGGRLGTLLELSSVFESPRPRPMMDVQMSRVEAGAATPVSEGTQTVSASVTARWQFIGGTP